VKGDPNIGADSHRGNGLALVCPRVLGPPALRRCSSGWLADAEKLTGSRPQHLHRCVAGLQNSTPLGPG